MVKIKYELLFIGFATYSYRSQCGAYEEKPHNGRQNISTDWFQFIIYRRKILLTLYFQTRLLIVFIFVSCANLMDSAKGAIQAWFRSTTVGHLAAVVAISVMERDDNRIRLDYFSAYRRRKLLYIKT